MRRSVNLLLSVLIFSFFTSSAIAANFTYYLPYFISDSGHWTAVGLRNNSDTSSADVDVTVYNTLGNVVSTQNTVIPPRGQDSFAVGQNADTTGWIKIESDREISGLCFFASTSGLDYMADIPLVVDLADLLYVPHVGQGPVFDTNILACNPNGSKITVTVRFVDQGGSVIFTQSFDIPANGSKEFKLSGMVNSSNQANSGSVELSAGSPFAAFAVYTNRKKGQYGFAGINAVIPGGSDVTPVGERMVNTLWGSWDFLYEIGSSSFIRSYYLNDFWEQDPNNPNQFWLYGTDIFGDLVTAGFDQTYCFFALLDEAGSFDRYYTFAMISDTVVIGNYVQTDPVTGQFTSNIYLMGGERLSYFGTGDRVVLNKPDEPDEKRMETTTGQPTPEHVMKMYKNMKAALVEKKALSVGQK